MALVTYFDLELHQIDVKITLMNIDLKYEVYLRQPNGFMDNSQNSCKLKKYINRLGQISCRWYTFYKVITLLFIENFVSIYTLMSVEVVI
jgi:hypothetical protein